MCVSLQWVGRELMGVWGTVRLGRGRLIWRRMIRRRLRVRRTLFLLLDGGELMRVGTVGVIGAYVVIIAVLWNIPYVKHVLYPFSELSLGLSSSRDVPDLAPLFAEMLTSTFDSQLQSSFILMS